MIDITTLKPIRGRMMAEVLKDEKISQGGIVIPDKRNLKEKPHRARVVKVGGEDINKKTGQPRPLAANVGNIVHFAAYSGKILAHRDKMYVFLWNEEIIGVERRSDG